MRFTQLLWRFLFNGEDNLSLFDLNYRYYIHCSIALLEESTPQ